MILIFAINRDNSIALTRGDIAVIEVSAMNSEGKKHLFKEGDVIRFRVLEKNHPETVIVQKDVLVSSETSDVEISLTKEDTKLGQLIGKPVDYWYEIELNPETDPQTLLGYDASGPKIFRLYPEGGDKE